jgi:acyl carrier protein
MHTSPHAQAASCFNTPNATTTREPIEQWIVHRLSACAGLAPQEIDIELPCTAYGLDSLTGLTLVGDLELWLHIRLSPILLWEVSSIDQLVQYLVDAWLATSGDTVRGSDAGPAWSDGLDLSPEAARQLLSHLDQLSDQEVETMLYQLAA